MEYIRRHIEDIIKKANGDFKAVLLTGPRQVGKSTTLRKMYKDIPYITLDDIYYEELAKNNPNMFMDLNRPPLFIDEVQRAPELFRNIKMVCDDTSDKGLFLLSGSQPMVLMEKASESLAGRVAVIEMCTLSLREIIGCDFNEPFIPTMEYIKRRNGEYKKIDDIWNIIHRGMYPEIQDKNIDWSLFYSGYVRTYLERDVRMLSAVQDLEAFTRFMVACASRTGQVLNISNIANEIGKDNKTVSNWISILQASGIIYLLEPYSSNSLKRVIRSPKLYFRDTGLAAYLLRWQTPEVLALGAMNGAFFETFVISEILKSYANKGLDYKYYVSYYRDREAKEIDFIIEENGVLYPIEIKMTLDPKASMTSSFMELDKINDKKRGTGAIICACSTPSLIRENIFQIPYSFL